MSFNFKEFAVAALLPVITAVAEEELKVTLAGIKEHNTPEVYENTLKSLNSTFNLLKEAALKTKTQIDDGFVNIVLSVVSEVAAEDNIQL